MGPRGGRHRPPGVVRFIGVDGYRWMIRCVVNGPPRRSTRCRRGAKSVGGHRRSPRRHAAAGAHAVAGAAARADGWSSCGPPPAGRSRQQAQQALGQLQQQRSSRPTPEPGAAAARRARPCSSCAPHRRLAEQASLRARPEQAAPSAAGSAPISSSVTVRSAACGAAATQSLRHAQRVDRVVDRSGNAQRHAEPSPARPAVGRDVVGGLLHGVGQRGPLARQDRVSSSASHARAGRAHLRWSPRPGRRAAAVRRMPGRQRRGRRLGRPGPGRQRGQHRDRPIGVGQRPARRDRGADRHAADRDRRVRRGLVERLPGSRRSTAAAAAAGSCSTAPAPCTRHRTRGRRSRRRIPFRAAAPL